MRIVIVVGESSGDILGAGLMQALTKLSTDSIDFVGIGGAKMCALGFQSLFPMERLSVMGLVEPLKRLPELLSMRKAIKQYCCQHDVDCFIGIDSPDFNLNIERFTRKQNIKTVHYVSPSVWAWRQGRVKGIRKSVDLMLTLLPFESDFYRLHGVPEQFVGHPLADDITLSCDTEKARKLLDINEVIGQNTSVITLMPGSRGGEVRLLGGLFLAVASNISDKLGDCLFLLPAASAERKSQIEEMLAKSDARLHIRVLDGQSHQAMAASDVVLLASGTTALEAMLFKKPMVVAYKMAPLSYAIISRLVKSKYVSLPNLLADKALVPELLQDDATVENLTAELYKLLASKDGRQLQIQAFNALHESIRCDASATAARSILELIAP